MIAVEYGRMSKGGGICYRDKCNRIIMKYNDELVTLLCGCYSSKEIKVFLYVFEVGLGVKILKWLSW